MLTSNKAIYQSENTDLVDQFNWNYRHNRFDVFGSFEYVLDNGHYPSTITTLVKADTLWNQKFDQDYKPKKQTEPIRIVRCNYSQYSSRYDRYSGMTGLQALCHIPDENRKLNI